MNENHHFGHQRQLESSHAALHELLEAMERTVIEQSMRLEDALNMSQRAARAKSEFLSTVSHEIRTPMNAVLGMADLLGETDLAPEQRHYLDIMVANGNALMDLINSILDLARIESGRLRLEHSQFDLTDLIDRTVSTFAVQAHRKRLELVARIAPEVPDYLVGDPLQLRQIIVHLVSNAIKFTEKGGVVVEVETTPRSSALADVTFKVSDTGIGIAREQLDSIYTNFTQGDSSFTRKIRRVGSRPVDCQTAGRLDAWRNPGRERSRPRQQILVCRTVRASLLSTVARPTDTAGPLWPSGVGGR